MIEVGAGLHQERLALGETVNLAFRLLDFAEPDTIVMSDSSRRVLGNAIVSQSLGRKDAKGIRRPIELHRVLRARGEADPHPSLETPFVGREDALAVLLERLV